MRWRSINFSFEKLGSAPGPALFLQADGNQCAPAAGSWQQQVPHPEFGLHDGRSLQHRDRPPGLQKRCLDDAARAGTRDHLHDRAFAAAGADRCSEDHRSGVGSKRALIAEPDDRDEQFWFGAALVQLDAAAWGASMAAAD